MGKDLIPVTVHNPLLKPRIRQMEQFTYIGIDRELADAICSINPEWQFSHVEIDPLTLDAISLDDAPVASLDDFGVSSSLPTIAYCGRFEHGSDVGARVSLRHLTEWSREANEPLAGVVVLTAWMLVSGRPPKHYQRSIPGLVRFSDDHWTGKPSPRWQEVFWPDGFRQRLSDISPKPFMLSKIDRLAYDILDATGLPPDRSVYELHLTVNCNSESEFEQFQGVCADIGIKCIQILLAQGDFQHQTITGSFHRGSLQRVMDQARDVAAHIERRGFSVSRMKLEAMINNSIVPTTSEAAANMTDSQYFECHAKIVVPSTGPSKALAELCERHEAHLSRNPSNRLGDDNYCVFVTQRFFKTPKNLAMIRFAEFIHALREGKFTISNILREYALLDTNIAIDEAWIPHQLVTSVAGSESTLI